MTPQNELAFLETCLGYRVMTLETDVACGNKKDIAIARERVEAFLAANGARMEELREMERGRV